MERPCHAGTSTVVLLRGIVNGGRSMLYLFYAYIDGRVTAFVTTFYVGTEELLSCIDMSRLGNAGRWIIRSVVDTLG